VARKPSSSEDSVVKELVAIKKLLILALMKGGATQSEIGKTLGIDRSHVSRMVPSQKVSLFKLS